MSAHAASTWRGADWSQWSLCPRGSGCLQSAVVAGNRYRNAIVSSRAHTTTGRAAIRHGPAELEISTRAPMTEDAPAYFRNRIAPQCARSVNRNTPPLSLQRRGVVSRGGRRSRSQLPPPPPHKDGLLTCISLAAGEEQRGASTSSGGDAGYAVPAPPRPPVELLRPAEPSRLLEMLTSEGHGSPAAMSRPGPPPPHPLPHHALQHPHPHPHPHPRVPGQPGESSSTQRPPSVEGGGGSLTEASCSCLHARLDSALTDLVTEPGLPFVEGMRAGVSGKKGKGTAVDGLIM